MVCRDKVDIEDKQCSKQEIVDMSLREIRRGNLEHARPLS